MGMPHVNRHPLRFGLTLQELQLVVGALAETLEESGLRYGASDLRCLVALHSRLSRVGLDLEPDYALRPDGAVVYARCPGHVIAMCDGSAATQSRSVVAHG